MKHHALLANIALFIIILSSSSYAVTYPVTESNGFSATTGGSDTVPAGFKFTTNTSNLILSTCGKLAGSTVTNCIILNSTFSIIGNASFTGNIATLNLTLPYVGVFYVAGTSNGASYTQRSTSGSFPVNGQVMVWNSGGYCTPYPSQTCSGWNLDTTAREIANLTFLQVASAAGNFTISLNDNRTGLPISGFSWNFTTTNASDDNAKSGYCSGSSCSITNFTGLLNVSVFNVSGSYFSPYDSPKMGINYTASSTIYTFQTFRNSLSMNLTNSVNGSAIASFCGNVSNSTSSVSSCTTNGTLTIAGIIGDLTLLWHNVTGGTYFNTSTSITSFNSTSANYTSNTSQGLLNITATQLFTNASIQSFNATNSRVTNTTSTSSLLLPANIGNQSVMIQVAGNYTQNITCNLPSNLQTVTCSATGFYDSRYIFNATDIYNNIKINSYSVAVTNGALGGVLYNQSTTNGTLNLSLIQGYPYLVSFSTSGGLYEYDNTTVTPNSATGYYTFQVLPAPSVDVTIRNAATDALITTNMTIRLTGNTTDTTIYTTSGGYFFQNLTPGSYTVRISGANYTESTYQVTATAGTVYFLTAYLQQNTGEVILQFLDSITSSLVIPSASVSQERQINGTWQVVTTKTTDVTGRAPFDYITGIEYHFIAIKQGYATKEFSLNPILFDNYQIKMQRTTRLNFSQDFQSIYLDYDPETFYDGRENTLNITFSSPLGTFTNYTYTIFYPGGNKTGGGNNIVGESFTIPFNITGSNYLSRVNITLTYDTSIGSTHRFDYSNGILLTPSDTTHIANKDNHYGMGLLERLFIVTIVVLLVAGAITLGLGPVPGLFVAILLYGYFIKIGFIEWWACGITFLVGFALLAARSD